MKILILFSGPLAVGKSTVTRRLIEEHGFSRVASSAYLKERASQQGLGVDRQTLQEIGDRLDADTDYRWLIDDVAVPTFEASPLHERWLVDSVRKRRQLDHFRDKFGRRVLHVHLTAPEKELRRRYKERLTDAGHNEGSTTYADAVAHSNERSARGLVDLADLVLEVNNGSRTDLDLKIMNHLEAS